MKKSNDNLNVTAIVATYNRAHFLSQSLDSLLAQSRPIDEIIVIDDASSDHTDQIMQRYIDRVRYVRNLKNSGKPASLNFAIPLARGTQIWIFDDDDVALPDALANHIAYLAANPTIDFSYSDKYIFEGAGDIWQNDLWRIERLPEIKPENFLQRTLYSMNTMFQAMLVPARCYRAAGPFDETLDRCEDHDMLLRLARLFRADNMGSPSFVYRHHDGVRGSRRDAHKAEDRFQVMLGYRQRIFRRARRDFPLETFELQAGNDLAFASSRDNLALLQRGCVMLHHGLVEEALTDMAEALPALSSADHQNPALCHMLSVATDIEAWIWPDANRNLARLARLLAHTDALALSKPFARGLYWQARSASAKGERIDGVRLLGWMLRFLARCHYYR